MLTTIISILATASLAAFGYVFQLGNRVTKVETQIEDLPELINSQFEDVSRRLDRIERAMNGSLKHVD